MTTKFKELIETGPNFWNIRGKFHVMKMVDIGNQMSIARLSSGKFLVIDAIPLTPTIKQEIDQLTENGSKIEAFLATHPFHSLSIPAFHQAYPELAYYGTPRHLRKLTNIKWTGDLNDCKTRALWEPDVEMRIPAGECHSKDRDCIGDRKGNCNSMLKMNLLDGDQIVLEIVLKIAKEVVIQ